MSEPSRAVYYALDADPRCLAQFRRSVASVRRACGSLPIYLAFAGELAADDRALVDDLRVRVLPTRLDGTPSPTFMKWRALAQGFRETDVLYLDTDTVAVGDVSRLFELGDADFHARCEVACDPDPDAYPYLINTYLISGTQIDHSLFDALCERLGVRRLPVWNTGVMLFRNGLAGRLAGRWDDFVRLYRLFRRKRLPYPCRNPHIVEEVIASLVLGSIAPLRWSFLPRASCPWFLEYMARDASGAALVVHTWADSYAGYLCQAGDREALRAYLALPGGRYRQDAASLLLGLGTSTLRVPAWALDRWLRHGAARLASAAAT